MAFYLASIVTLILIAIWGLYGFIVYDIPAMLYLWVSGHPWGQKPWMEKAIEWFTIPAIWLLVFIVLWIFVIILFGRPMAVLARYGPHPKPEKHPVKFWQHIFMYVSSRYDAGSAAPFGWIQCLTWIGVILSTAACVLALLKPSAATVWTAHPSMPMGMFLVATGMSFSIRDTLHLLYKLKATDDAQAAEGSLTQVIKEVTSEPLVDQLPDREKKDE